MRIRNFPVCPRELRSYVYLLLDGASLQKLGGNANELINFAASIIYVGRGTVGTDKIGTRGAVHVTKLPLAEGAKSENPLLDNAIINIGDTGDNVYLVTIFRFCPQWLAAVFEEALILLFGPRSSILANRAQGDDYAGNLENEI